jgi:hypothetical protein
MTDAYRNRIATPVPGSDMVLSCRVRSTIADGLPSCLNDTLNGGEIVIPPGAVSLHAVEEGAGLPKELLARCGAILRRFGNIRPPPSRSCSGK